MDLTNWIGMVRRDANTEIEASDLREILLNLMKTVPPGSAEHTNLHALQEHFRNVSERSPAPIRTLATELPADEPSVFSLRRICGTESPS